MFKSAWFHLSVGKKDKNYHEKKNFQTNNKYSFLVVFFFFIVKNDFATHCLYTKVSFI